MTTIPKNIGPDYRPIGSDGALLIADSTQANKTRWGGIASNNLIPSIDITSLTCDFTTVWTGTGVLNPTFTITYNTSVSGAWLIGGSSGYYINTPYTSAVATGLWSGSVPNFTRLFTIIASGAAGSGSDSTGIVINWQQKQYWGKGIDGGAYTQSFIEQFGSSPSGGSQFNSNHYWQVSGAMTSGFYWWYSFRLDAGTPVFTDLDSGMNGGFFLVTTGITFANPAGYSETYQLWRSYQHGIGSGNFIVSTG